MSRATLSKTSYTTTFNPTSIAGCKLWLDAADSATITYTSGININQWNDKSGNGYNATQFGTSSTTYSANGLSGYPAINFANTNANMVCSIPAGTFPSGVTGFVVAITNNGTISRCVNNIPAPFDANTTSAVVGNGSGFQVFSSSYNLGSSSLPIVYAFTVTTPMVFTQIVNGTTYTNYSIYSTAAAYGDTATTVTIGVRQDRGWIATGYFSEILMYNSILTATQRQQVEGYLAWKWGTQASLSGGHLYVSAAPIGVSLRPALSAALAPTPVKAMGKASYNVAFNPISIAGCVLWFDAYDASYTTSGNTVTTWVNKSGGANAVTGAGTVSINQAFLNGKSSVRFPGGGGSLSIGSTTFSTAYRTAFVVATTPTGTGPFGYVNTTITDNKIMQVLAFSSTIELDRPGTLGIVASTPSGVYGATALITGASSNGNQGIWVNGSSQTITTNNIGTSSTFFSTGTTTNLALGCSGLVDIYEILYFDGGLTTTQCQQVEGYLAWKWGLQGSLPTFTPTSITGCKLWLDGADATTLSLSGTIVTQWRDKSGNANNTTTIGGSPTYTSNFINLNGTTTYLVGPYVNTTQFLTMIVLATVNFSQGDYGSYYRLLSVGSTGASDYDNVAYTSILHAAGANQIGGYRNSATNFATVITNTRFIIVLQYDGTNGINYINGTSASTVASTGTFGTSSYSIGRDVGNGFGAYTYWPGTVGEVIVYNASLTMTQRQSVEGYLAAKWGIQASLPNTHPYYSSAPTGHPYFAAAPIGANLRPAISQALVPAGVRTAAATAKPTTTQIFTYTGADQTFVVPATTTSLTVYMWGGGGGGGYTGTGTLYGGAGAYVQGVLSVTPSTTLKIIVGGGGEYISSYPATSYTYGGGGTGGNVGGSGGGRSAIRISGATDDLVTVGAGGGSAYWSYNNSYGGNGDSVTGTGVNGGTSGSYYGGLGGSQLSGGAVGYGDAGYGISGGSKYTGGNAVPETGGGGGAGYYGGGGGGYYNYGSGGGGGSSLTSNLTSLVVYNSPNRYSAPNTASPYYQAGVGGGGSNGQSGNPGRVVITYIA